MKSMPKSKKPFVERKKFKDGGDVEELTTQPKNQVTIPDIPSLGTNEKDSPRLPAKELFNTFTNVYREKTTNRDLQILMAGLGISEGTLGIDLVNMSADQRNMMAQNLLAQYQTKLGDTNVQGRVVRPLNAPSGIYEMGVNASRPLGQGRISAGVNAVRTPEDTRVLGYNVGYGSKVGPGFLSAGVNIPKGGPKPSAQLNYRVPFKEGGLLQEGGTVDEESGNEVPVGSLKKEVRDDIPAQLSEGEFVFPADVVRFIGLQKLMELRQAAKEGLSKMEAMGQMGNSDEATEEDTGEFETELDDIFKEIEEEGTSSKKDEGEQRKMAVGGFLTVPPKVNPTNVPFSVERYSKEGEKDIFMPTFGGKAQAAVPEGFEKSTKVQSFGGVFREQDEAQPTVSTPKQQPSLNQSLATEPQRMQASSVGVNRGTEKESDTTATDLTKTVQPIPKAYAGLDSAPPATNPVLQYLDPKSSGGAWGTKAGKSSGAGFGFEGMVKQIEQRLATKGVTAENIGQLSVREVDGPPITKQVQKFYEDDGKYSYKVLSGEGDDQRWVELTPEQLQKVRTEQGPEGDSVSYIDLPQKQQEVYDKSTGKTIAAGQSIDLGGWGEGPGITYGSLTFDEKGKPKISTYGEDTSDAKYIAPALMLATLPFGGIGGIIGSATGASTSLAAGLTSAGLSTTAASIVTGAITNAATNGILAAVTGGNVGKAMTSGAISGGIGASAMELSNAVLGTDTVNSIAKATNLTPKQVASVFSSSVASGINTAVAGGDFSDITKTFGQSLIASGVSEMAATTVMKQLKDTLPADRLKGVSSATKMLSNVAINAGLKGLDVDKAIKYYAPQVLSKAFIS